MQTQIGRFDSDSALYNNVITKNEGYENGVNTKGTKEFRKQFLVNRDETGREIVTYWETGKSYFIEYVEPRSMKDREWGDINPATKKLEVGTYGKKNRGGIKAEESMITKENGFDNIIEGMGSPYATIEFMHNKWKAENGY